MLDLLPQSGPRHWASRGEGGVGWSRGASAPEGVFGQSLWVPSGTSHQHHERWLAYGWLHASSF